MTSDFTSRHIGPREQDLQEMLTFLKLKDLDDLIGQCAPASILSKGDVDLGSALSEPEFLSKARHFASKNKVFKTYLGQGYYDTYTPGVIQRNILENPAWYTAYTPYQAEISQGRMEALLNFQTMIKDLTALDIANSSLLDEGTAVAEAMAMAFNLQRKKVRRKIFISDDIFPQSLEVLETRAEPLGIEVILGPALKFTPTDEFFAAVFQFPTAQGEIEDYESICKENEKNKILNIIAADLLALTLLKPPGEWGADIVVGSSQRFGVPMGYGGPHAAFICTKDAYKRLMPGRIIGISKDNEQRPALRLALQTREQHIRREKATSNICTAQVLLAVMASMYAVYHGPKGLIKIANKVHQLTSALAEALSKLGFKIENTNYFDTICLQVANKDREEIIARAQKGKINLNQNWPGKILISLDETTGKKDLDELLKVFSKNAPLIDEHEINKNAIPENIKRTSSFLENKVFNSYHSETEMLRYITRLQNKDLSLCHSMIPLGSCTMKLNATSEMQPVSWPEFSRIHPFSPVEQTEGYLKMIHQLECWLTRITGFAALSLQPNAGSQGEFAGLMVIRKYLQDNNQGHRKICLIPSSAHGTNPASANMAGMNVVVVKCDDQGNIDLQDLKNKISANSGNVAALMITYPSTHGVFESTLVEICELIHKEGGQVYMDGANLNALLGISLPGKIGPDVCHLNLHKTFCIPHGGGGPGIGPIAVVDHLKDYLPGNKLLPQSGGKKSVGAISAAPFGSASILPISWAYMAMMGQNGLKKATQVAILNANYIAKRLADHYPVLFKGRGDWVAHECIIDPRNFKNTAAISVDDIAKRLMDYGFHGPTMSWPVTGTLMIEPTESESKEEIDRFCDAMIQIRQEIREIENGVFKQEDNVLVNAPHCIEHMTADKWNHSYDREKAAFPLAWVKQHKFWTSVGRVDNAWGDRNLVCSCPGLEAYS